MSTGTGVGAGGGFAALFTDLLAELANASLGLDPASSARLAALDGRAALLEVVMPGAVTATPFTLAINDGRVDLYAVARPSPNVIARGRLAAFSQWLTTGAATGITIDGDEAVLTELLDVLRAFRPRLPPMARPPAAGLTGNPLAESVLSLAEGAVAALRSAAEGAGLAVKAEAKERYASSAALAPLLDRLDTLRLRTDRLAARIEALDRPEQP